MNFTRVRSTLAILFASALVFLGSPVARAAENTSTIEGVVQDASGRPVTGAFVKLRNRDRHLEFLYISQAQGKYTANNLPAGKYTVQGVGEGFQSDLSAPVEVGEGKTTKQDL
jgi:hypothetical protein